MVDDRLKKVNEMGVEQSQQIKDAVLHCSFEV
jgi:hypothetical protein